MGRTQTKYIGKSVTMFNTLSRCAQERGHRALIYLLIHYFHCRSLVNFQAHQNCLEKRRKQIKSVLKDVHNGSLFDAHTNDSCCSYQSWYTSASRMFAMVLYLVRTPMTAVVLISPATDTTNERQLGLCVFRP
ncbi:uncharacterized protein LOC143257445 isoform X2 [Tachypleus tridentatus]|uniref:uncharacterized protein LOC143257445 isoform X2 n=1 Tax=Tachypleus tridentatus TaxID=6853 RepID=UPI003FCF0E50